MGDRVTPEELHDWHRDRHGFDCPRRTLDQIIDAAAITVLGAMAGKGAVLLGSVIVGVPL